MEFAWARQTSRNQVHITTIRRAKENDKEVDKGHLTLIGSYHSKQLLDKNLSFFLIEMDILLKEKNIVITIDK